MCRFQSWFLLLARSELCTPLCWVPPQWRVEHRFTCVMCVHIAYFLLHDTEGSALERGYANRICMHKYLRVPVTMSVTWNRETGTEKAPPAKKMTTRMKKEAFLTCWLL